MDAPPIAFAGADNPPDFGGTGAPMVPPPAGIPSVPAAPPPAAAPPVTVSGSVANPNQQAIDRLSTLLQPPPENNVHAALRKALPLIAAAFAARAGGNSLGALMSGYDKAQQDTLRQQDVDAQKQERLAIAIKNLQAEELQRRKLGEAEAREAALEKAKIDAAREKELHDIATHSLDAAAKGGLFDRLNAMVDKGEDVDTYLQMSKLGTSPDAPALSDLVKKGYIFRDPSGHFDYATSDKDLEPLTKEMTQPDGQYKYTIDRKTGQIIPSSWEYLGPSNKAPVDPLVEAIRAARVNALKESDADAEATADAIIDGTQPPDLSRLYGKSLAVRAALARKGFDLTSATKDWQATSRMLGSLNSPQQLRLRQSITTAYSSLDVIDKLAAEWDGGPLPPLNKANLIAARNGAYGPHWAQVATQLEGQITDVVSELGQVYQGGYSPTDQALGLAKKNLSADWDESVLHSMTKLARKNLQIRENSINTSAPAGASPNNPYFQHQTPDDPFGINSLLPGAK